MVGLQHQVPGRDKEWGSWRSPHSSHLGIAADLGLVDRLGTLEDARRMAARMGGMDEDAPFLSTLSSTRSYIFWDTPGFLHRKEQEIWCVISPENV